MTLDTAIGACAIVLAMLWPIHQQLTIRALRRALQQLHRRQAQAGRAIIQLQTTVANTPLQVHQPMPRVGRYRGGPATPGGTRSTQITGGGFPAANRPALVTGSGSREPSPPPCDADPTLRLQTPPSLTRIADRCRAAGLMTVPREALARIAAIEHHLAAGRSATRMELARALDVQPWEVAADLHTAVLAKIVTTTSGHTAAEATYRLCDPTIRMDSMPILWGAR